ncbi:MAG: hypothetical protein JJT89_07815 [Nitriliruptoraceae bacterium]|nr:hypothetical protein [Nitriliruptoraceae bacterium]
MADGTCLVCGDGITDRIGFCAPDCASQAEQELRCNQARAIELATRPGTQRRRYDLALRNGQLIAALLGAATESAGEPLVAVEPTMVRVT